MPAVDTTIWNLPEITAPLEDTARIPVSIGDGEDDTFQFELLDLNSFLDGFFLPLTGGTMSGAIDMGDNFINNVTNPVSDQDAATKLYVDTIATALDWKTPVVVATTENIGLANLQTIDGVSLVASDRVLVKDQTDNTQNGIYSVVDSADWTRTTDADTPTELEHATVFTELGTTNNGKAYTQIADIVTVGDDPIIWMEIFQITPVTAGDGLSFTGTILNVGGTAGKIAVGTDTVDVGDDVVTIDDTHTYNAGFKQLFTPDSTNPGINIGSIESDPTGFVDADMWYDSGDDKFMAGINSGLDEFLMVDQVQVITGVKTFGTTSDVGKLKLAGVTSGIITLDAFEEAGTNTLTLPAITDTIVTRGNIESLTNKTFIEVERSDGTNANYTARVHNNSVTIRGVFGAAKSRGTESIPLALQLGDDIGGLEGLGHDGTNFSLCGEIIFKASENWTVDDHGSEIEFLTTPDNSINPTPRLLIQNDGTTNFLTNDIINVGTLTIDTLSATTVISDTYTSQSGNDIILNAPVSQGVEIQVNTSTEYTFNAGVANWGNNRLESMGALSFADTDTFIVQDTLNLHTSVATGGTHAIRVNDINEYTYNSTQADFNTNDIVNVGAMAIGATTPGNNDLFIESSAVARFRIEGQFASIQQNISTEFDWTYRRTSDGNAIMDLMLVPEDGESTAILRFGLNSGSTGNNIWRFIENNGTAIQTQLTSSGGNTFFNALGGNIGIGISTSAPASLTCRKTDDTPENSFEIRLQRQRETDPEDVLLGDSLGKITFHGADTAAPAFMEGGRVEFLATENWAGTDHGTQLEISTTANLANLPTIRLIIEEDGTANFQTNTLSNVVDPVNSQDAATKNYVDSFISSSLGNMEINLITASPANILTINVFNTYVAYGTTNWVEPTTNTDFSSTTAGVMTYNGTTRSFKVDMWSNVSDSTGTGVQDEFTTGLFVNAVLYSPSEMRCGRNGGSIARSFVIELDNADALDIRSKNMGSSTNGEYTNVGMILTPLPL